MHYYYGGIFCECIFLKKLSAVARLAIELFRPLFLIGQHLIIHSNVDRRDKFHKVVPCKLALNLLTRSLKFERTAVLSVSTAAVAWNRV